MGKTRQAVSDALNGDINSVDPALRRGLYAISTMLDTHMVDSAADHLEMMTKMAERFEQLDGKLNRATKLLISTTSGFVISVVLLVFNVIFN